MMTLHASQPRDEHAYSLFQRAANRLAQRALAIAVGLMPLVLAFLYTVIFLRAPDVSISDAGPQIHLLTLVACTYFMAIFAWRAHGQLDSKLSQVLGSAALSFGSLALFLIGSRTFYSRQMLFTALSVATLMGIAIVLIKHRISGPRICIIGPLTPGAKRQFGTLVTDPAADLRNFDILLVSLGESVSSDWANALSRAMLNGAKVRHIGEYEEEFRGTVSLEHFELDHISGVSITSYRLLKRSFDVVAALVLSIAAAPVICIAMLGIFLSMGRPVFFTQERIGLGGRRFKMWKLRTMRNARPGDAVVAVSRHDPRITTFGRVLRRFRFDELPQFWNVLKGDMSLIGPRPEAVSLHEDYLLHTPAWAYRNLVRPGITGWAQVSTTPSSNREEAARKLTYDLYYIKRLSLFLDFKIFLKTFWTLTSGGGVR